MPSIQRPAKAGAMYSDNTRIRHGQPMQELDRTTAPQTQMPQQLRLPTIAQHRLDNGLVVHRLHDPSQEVVRLDLVFNAGYWYQDKPLVASSTNALLNAGTPGLSSHQIAERLDFWGSHLRLETFRHTASLSLISLQKHLASSLALVEEMVKQANYPNHELENHVANRLQEFRVGLEKSDVVATRQFTELLFGEEHPYGRLTQASDYAALCAEDLRQFHQSYYVPHNCQMVLAGNVPESVLHLLNQHFGQNQWRPNQPEQINQPASPELCFQPGRSLFLARAKAQQSTIRIGLPTIILTHPHYLPLKLLSTVLGGYFGSRLMQNLREDKGYTYGIHAQLVSAPEAGSFSIGADVAAEATQAALDEIYLELERLCEEPIPEDELENARSFMLGDLLRQLDGPFATADALKMVLPYGLGIEFWAKAFELYRSTQADTLQSLAREYLRPEAMIEVVVGSHRIARH